MNEAPGRMILLGGKPFLFFSGYSYLGMSHVRDFTELLKEGIDLYGGLFPSSRISNTPLALFGHLEHYLSQLTGTGGTVTYASGYLACQAVGHLLGEFPQILVAPGMHPASGLEATEEPVGVDPRSGTFEAFEAWSRWVVEYVRNSTHDHFVLAAPSVDPLTGVVFNFVFLQDLPRKKRFTVLIDDSHGIGWRGEHGEGIASSLMNLSHVEYLLVYSMAKALHIQGGAVSGPPAWAERLRQSSFYSASTPMGPAWAHTLLQAGPLYEVQRTRLGHNMVLMNRLLEKALVEEDPAGVLLEPTALPILLCKGKGLGAYLEQRGILISSFAYPDPQGARVERVILSALHEARDLDALVRACNVFPYSATNR
jgi:8-amino-7-oxononanoate synthase